MIAMATPDTPIAINSTPLSRTGTPQPVLETFLVSVVVNLLSRFHTNLQDLTHEAVRRLCMSLMRRHRQLRSKLHSYICSPM